MSHFTVLIIGENPEAQLQPYHEYECTGVRDEHVIFVEDDECEIDKKTGKKGRWTNPNSKWDWYSLGGRWAGFFTLKPDKEGVQGHHRAKDFAAINGDVIEDLPLTVADQAYKGDIDFEKMRNHGAVATHAVIMNGKWYERGRMGWFAMVADEKDSWDAEFSKLLDSVPDDALLSIYDCHI